MQEAISNQRYCCCDMWVFKAALRSWPVSVHLSAPPLQPHPLYPRSLHCHFTIHPLDALRLPITWLPHPFAHLFPLVAWPSLSSSSPASHSLISLSVHIPAQFHSSPARPLKFPWALKFSGPWAVCLYMPTCIWTSVTFCHTLCFPVNPVYSYIHQNVTNTPGRK